MRVLKKKAQVALVLGTCTNSIIGLNSVEYNNMILYSISMIINLLAILILCKYGREF